MCKQYNVGILTGSHGIFLRLDVFISKTTGLLTQNSLHFMPTAGEVSRMWDIFLLCQPTVFATVSVTG